MPRRHVSQPLEVVPPRGDHAARSQHRLDNDGGEILAVPANDRLGRLRIIEREHHHIADHAVRHPARGRKRRGGSRVAGRGRIRAHGDRGILGRAVEPALGFGDLPPPGAGAGQAEGKHHRLGPRACEPDALHRRHPPDDALGETDLVRGRRGKCAPPPHLPLDGGDHGGRTVAEDQRGVVVREINPLVAVDVGDPAPQPARHIGGKRIEVHRGARDPAGKHRPGALMQLLRTPVPAQVLLDDRLPVDLRHRRTPGYGIPG